MWSSEASTKQATWFGPKHLWIDLNIRLESLWLRNLLYMVHMPFRVIPKDLWTQVGSVLNRPPSKFRSEVSLASPRCLNLVYQSSEFESCWSSFEPVKSFLGLEKGPKWNWFKRLLEWPLNSSEHGTKVLRYWPTSNQSMAYKSYRRRTKILKFWSKSLSIFGPKSSEFSPKVLWIWFIILNLEIF